MKFIVHIYVKMPSIDGILTFISRINTTSESFKTKKNHKFSIKIIIFQHFSIYEVKFHAQLS